MMTDVDIALWEARNRYDAAVNKCFELCFSGTRIHLPDFELSDGAKSAIRAQMYPQIPDFDLR